MYIGLIEQENETAKPTSIEPESEGLVIRVFFSFNKVVKQAPPILQIHIHIPCKLPEPNLWLSRQFHHQIFFWVPIHARNQTHKNQPTNPPHPHLSLSLSHFTKFNKTHKFYLLFGHPVTPKTKCTTNNAFIPYLAFSFSVQN